MNSDPLATFTGRMEFASSAVGNATLLAQKTGISRRMIGDYLAGKSEPSRERLVAIARAAGVTVEWLATGEGPMRPGERVPELELHGPIPMRDIPREEMVAWLRQAWDAADDKHRAWLEVQFERCFPDFEAWKKKADESFRRQYGA